MQVPASGCVITEADKQAMHAAVDSGWLTEGRYTAEFERGLQDFTGIKHAMFVNSGSSANLCAVAAMVESGRWKRGDLILTVAASFPTTVNPLLLYGLVPVFVDIDLDTLNANVDQLWRASSQHKVKGIILAHTLGNPFDCAAVADIARQRKLGLVSDFCDALASTYDGKHVGNEADISTCSFFPAHMITSGGEGGAVFTDDEELAAIALSVRNWGRSCYCKPGENNTCGKRFEQQFGDLPYGYDHKSVAAHLGFNLKATEVQAACGLSQLRRIEYVAVKRRANAWQLYQRLIEHGALEAFVRDGRGKPCPFGMPLVLREEGIRLELQRYLASKGVDTRLVFSGNLVRHPYMKRHPHLVASELRNTDRVMHDGIWLGVHPELSDAQIEYAANTTRGFLDTFSA